MSEQIKQPRFVVNCHLWIRDCRKSDLKKYQHTKRAGFNSKNEEDQSEDVLVASAFHLRDVVTFAQLWSEEWIDPDMPECKVFFSNGNQMSYCIKGEELQRRFNEYHAYQEFLEAAGKDDVTSAGESVKIQFAR